MSGLGAIARADLVKSENLGFEQKQLRRSVFSEINKVAEVFTGPSSASLNVFTGPMTYTNQEMIDRWKKIP